MWAMIGKEFRQLRRDRQTLAMMIGLPLLLLVVFGYAASYDVSSISTTVVGPNAEAVAASLDERFDVTAVDPDGDRAEAERALRDGDTPVAFVADDDGATALLDGSELFTASSAQTALATQRNGDSATAAPPSVDVLYNEDLETSPVMVPGLAGMILLFVGTVVTSLGVVRERQAGTLEQLAVMPFRPRDVFLGKVAPYFLVASIDLVIVLVAGMWLFDVPFRGSVPVFTLGALLFLFVTLAIGVLVSTVSESQGQAIQLALMALLPQIMLSGLIFPLDSMAVGLRWFAQILPLTHFVEISRGVMLRGAPLDALWQPFIYLAVLGAASVLLATLRFRKDLAPAPRDADRAAATEPSGVGS